MTDKVLSKQVAHSRIVRWIDQVLAKKGWSARSWSLEATGQTDTIRNIMRGGSQDPRTDTLKKLIAVAGSAPEGFGFLADGDNQHQRSEGSVKLTKGTVSDRLPILGMAECGPDGWSLWNGDIIDTINMPANLVGVPNAYGVYVVGDSMEPRYQEGEIVHVHPGKPVTVGAYVLVQKRPPAPGEPPQAVVKRLLRRSGTKVTLEQLNPHKTIDLKPDDIVSMHRIVGSSEA